MTCNWALASHLTHTHNHLLFINLHYSTHEAMTYKYIVNTLYTMSLLKLNTELLAIASNRGCKVWLSEKTLWADNHLHDGIVQSLKLFFHLDSSQNLTLAICIVCFLIKKKNHHLSNLLLTRQITCICKLFVCKLSFSPWLKNPTLKIVKCPLWCYCYMIICHTIWSLAWLL